MCQGSVSPEHVVTQQPGGRKLSGLFCCPLWRSALSSEPRATGRPKGCDAFVTEEGVDTVQELVYALDVRRDGLARGSRTERRTDPQGECRFGREWGGGRNPVRRVTRQPGGRKLSGLFCCPEQTSLEKLLRTRLLACFELVYWRQVRRARTRADRQRLARFPTLARLL